MNLIDKALVDKLYSEGKLMAKFGDYMRLKHGSRVFKVPMDARFTCPNKDGRLSDDGCIFCPEFARQFTYPSFRRVIRWELEEQVRDQVEYYKQKGAGEKCLVYIAFGTNTYAPLDALEKIYSTALEAHEDVIGLSIGTRPDCLPEEVLDLLGSYVREGYEVWLELGLQTPHYHSLEWIGRHHGLAEYVRAVQEAHQRGICVNTFIMLGFRETRSEVRETARLVSSLGTESVKIYPTLVMRNTKLQRLYEEGGYRPLSSLEYTQLVADFVENLSPYVLIQRISKDCGLDGRIVPLWQVHRFLIYARVEKVLRLRGSRQGEKFKLTLTAEELEPLREAPTPEVF